MSKIKTSLIRIELGGEGSNKEMPIISFENRIVRKFGKSVLFSESANNEYVSNRFVDEECNQLLYCLNLAYSHHIPIKLTPDILWMTVIQGISEYVRLYPEKNRGILVSHEGKKELEVQEDQLLVDNQMWQSIPKRLIEKLCLDLDDKNKAVDELQHVFSTTMESDLNSFSVGILDVYSGYYDYTVSSMCNIPIFFLDGTLEDLECFEKKIKKLSTTLDLSWWLNHLQPIIDEIKNATNGEVNTNFWNSIYKVNNESGGPFINAWIINFFPFLKDLSSIGRDSSKLFPNWEVVEEKIMVSKKWKKVYGRNPFLGINEQAKTLTNSYFHEGLSIVDFIWNKMGDRKEMEMIGGFMGICKDSNYNCLQPGLG